MLNKLSKNNCSNENEHFHLAEVASGVIFINNLNPSVKKLLESGKFRKDILLIDL